MELTERIVNDIYYTDSRVGFEECDSELKIKLSDLLKRMVNAAGPHYEMRGVSHKAMYDHGQIFVLSRLSVRIESLPSYGDRITVSTWEAQPQSVFAVRNFEVLSEKGDVLASATSCWIIIDPHTRTVRRPSAFDLCEYRPVDRTPACSPCEKLKQNADRAPVESRRVRPSDTDVNGHLHSAFYTYFVTDALPEEYLTRTPKEIAFNYIKEARPNDVLDLYINKEGETFTVTAINGDAVCFTARFTY